MGCLPTDKPITSSNVPLTANFGSYVFGLGFFAFAIYYKYSKIYVSFWLKFFFKATQQKKSTF